MAKFKFRLQTFLNLSEQKEKSAKNELGVAIQKLERQKEILRQIQNTIEDQENGYRNEALSKMPILRLKQRIEYIKAIKEKEEEQQQRVNEEKVNVDKIRVRLIEIMKEKKIMEKLRQKEFTLFMKEQDKKAQLLVDELVSFNESKKTAGDEI